MQRQRIDVVIGTRPEAIKLAPVVKALAACGDAPRLLLTGQHRLDLAAHGLIGLDRVQLDCPGQSDPHRHAHEVARAIAPFLSDAPDLLVVQGDTSSAMGGALAGFAAAIPVAHVEAGLRTFDSEMPWPEEDYRVAIDVRAALLLAPTVGNADNLRREGVPGEIHVTGNSGIDALLDILVDTEPPASRGGSTCKLLVTCHRRENWTDGLKSVAAALVALADQNDVEADVLLHPNPTVAKTMRRLLGDHRRIRLVPPLDHADMIAAMRGSDILLSDSGGVQEEAPALGVPLLVLRDKTERPEGIASGNMILVGTDRRRIVDAVRALLDPAARAAMGRHAFPFGDGRAAPRIARHIRDYLQGMTEQATQARRA